MSGNPKNVVAFEPLQDPPMYAGLEAKLAQLRRQQHEAAGGPPEPLPFPPRNEQLELPFQTIVVGLKPHT